MSKQQKQQLDEELSRLLRKYETSELSRDEIVDSLEWHLDLAQVSGRKV